jgi:hypothetical protein
MGASRWNEEVKKFFYVTNTTVHDGADFPLTGWAPLRTTCTIINEA